MKDELIVTHYLSLSYKALVNNIIIHSFLFFIEICLLFFQTIEIFNNNYNINNNIYFSPFTYFSIYSNELSNPLRSIIYNLVIIFIIINSYIFNNYILKINFFVILIVNIFELIFYRILSLFLFNYLFASKDFYLIINFIFTILYICVLAFNFYKNHLFLFFPSIIKYPYDFFSMFIDLHLLPVKIFISISKMTFNKRISQLFFMLSICILFVLLFYLSYLMIYKSYYLMNNSSLNKIRYSFILSFCIITILILIIGNNQINNYYYIFSFFNIITICTLFISFIYDPYKFTRFDKDDNIENSFYYFFIYDRNKNENFLLEEKIEEHISSCNNCNLCRKYNIINNKNIEFDLYKIISNCNELIYNLLNKIIRGIKEKGKNIFINNSYFLINIIYIYCLAFKQKEYNVALNCELLFDLINSENKLFLEENKICLSHIKYSNNFFVNANKIIHIIYKILDEKQMKNNIQIYFDLGEKLKDIKYQDIKSNIKNNLVELNYNISNIEELPNCSNLLTICSLFYEELYNETFSGSGISIRNKTNLLEDLINNNYKNANQITLEINLLNFQIKIIRAGGYFNKYENNNFFNFFFSKFKKDQIKEMKKSLLYSDNFIQIKYEKDCDKNNLLKKNKLETENQYINFSFIIEERENEEIFCKLFKLKLSLILLANINNYIYLNGIYCLDNNIIITEKKHNKEILLSFGNKEQKNYSKNLYNNEISIINKKNGKYLGNKKLEKIHKYFGPKRYNVYYLLLNDKKYMKKYCLEKKTINKGQYADFEDENLNLLEGNNKLLLNNDIISQASSTNSNVSKNNPTFYNKGNMKTENNENVTKKLKIIKYILFFSIFSFLIFIAIGYTYLNAYQKKIEELVNFYLYYEDFYSIFQTLFFSVLSLSCIANSTESSSCKQYLGEYTDYIIEDYFKNLINIDNLNKTFLKSNFIDFIKYSFYQNQILSDNLKNKLNILINYLYNLDNDEFLGSFNDNLLHHIINQNYINDKIILNLIKENITFNEFNLLMISRFSIITKDINQLSQPIYILNKTGEEVFNNILIKDKLTTYQENIYLLILDYNIYSDNLDIIINEILHDYYHSKKVIKKFNYFLMTFNFVFIIIIIIIILLYIYTYLILILEIINKIENHLKEKLNNIEIKDILRKKMDNLVLLLNFYENDINNTINNLNNIYEDYKDKYNLKKNEDYKLLKYSENNKDNKITNYIKLVKEIKKIKLFQYTGRKSIYIYTLFFILLIFTSLYISNMIRWKIFFKKDYKVTYWNIIIENVKVATQELMNNCMMMIFNNKTLEEISIEFESNDFISLTYSLFVPVYELNKYEKYINDVHNIVEMTKFYDCSGFYENIDIEAFIKLKNKFKDEEDKFYYTLWFFCDWSKAMIFNNFNTIYLQLLDQVKTEMENFKNIKYNDIIESIEKENIIKNQIMYLIIYIYIMDNINKNVNSAGLAMTHRIYYNYTINN